MLTSSFHISSTSVWPCLHSDQSFDRWTDRAWPKSTSSLKAEWSRAERPSVVPCSVVHTWPAHLWAETREVDPAGQVSSAQLPKLQRWQWCTAHGSRGWMTDCDLRPFKWRGSRHWQVKSAIPLPPQAFIQWTNQHVYTHTSKWILNIHWLMNEGKRASLQGGVSLRCGRGYRAALISPPYVTHGTTKSNSFSKQG